MLGVEKRRGAKEKRERERVIWGLNILVLGCSYPQLVDTFCFCNKLESSLDSHPPVRRNPLYPNTGNEALEPK